MITAAVGDLVAAAATGTSDGRVAGGEAAG